MAKQIWTTIIKTPENSEDFTKLYFVQSYYQDLEDFTKLYVVLSYYQDLEDFTKL